MIGFLPLFIAAGLFLVALGDAMPSPFYRELYATDPMMTGNDVLIAQTLLQRDAYVIGLKADGVYGKDSASATSAFQSANGLSATGKLDTASAQLLLDLHEEDGYTDSGFSAASLGYLYKVHIPVHKNRSIETYATLFDKDNNVLFKFRARQHGHSGDGTDSVWPDYGTGEVGLTQLASNGNTPTGLVEIDLNSPEPDPNLYGPWPVNRVVRGLEGNALLMLPNIRDGVLIHTGNWTTSQVQWEPAHAMPNSAGCVHAHPTEVERIYTTLVALGVEVRDNTFSGKNYPYKPQGVGVIELMD
ncbi:hypothetical protein B484DRAFT_459479 [Ochromonadaceae sp. CCMP2298]|nr:hypothetical protein B484DRAFT_459479 [Ochromonadaceae sp. CCMP2298]|mmetsp:Transcript_30306/g.67067  ORF Transcript_30306/g.67067 Transcript_30306/m.67067 type:complete len:301 (+) Transcript_30306:150-1052(+)|eukprot:CAMPEP_0173201482 /NCGR_PEP_ID=MMETSP1141-20130122/18375_1 /TAXON_ID=483371 /ORGANISM="non described non described, Strain CCMP2298" /LENGTH=300 /DNA_ID=CAMNT_0014126607 /DNA_START=85 /DNA_END=987 /DNA_ORIENTATION=+